MGTFLQTFGVDLRGMSLFQYLVHMEEHPPNLIISYFLQHPKVEYWSSKEDCRYQNVDEIACSQQQYTSIVEPFWQEGIAWKPQGEW